MAFNSNNPTGPSYWTLRRKSKEMVDRHLEAISLGERSAVTESMEEGRTALTRNLEERRAVTQSVVEESSAISSLVEERSATTD